MNNGVLLDTSYLISLVDANRKNHQVAVDFYRLMLQHGIPMFLSSIVVSEFSVKQPITDLPLGNFRIIPFNVTHGIEAAKIWNLLGTRDPSDPRAVVRDDVKLMAQAEHEAIPFLITEDASTLFKYCDKLRSAGKTHVAAIKLIDGFKPGSLGLADQSSLI